MNEWIQDATDIWNDKESIKEYLSDVIYDRDMIADRDDIYPFEFNMIKELNEAIVLLNMRIDELRLDENRQLSFNF